jgi:hypothetical protein
MNENEIISQVESLLAANRKGAIISTIIWGCGLALFLFVIGKASEMFSTIIDLDERGFWFSCLFGAMAGWAGITIIGVIAQNLVVIFRKSVVFRGLDLLLKYHAERKSPTGDRK